MNNNLKEGLKVSTITLIGNFLLSIFKFIAGIIGKSSAMISDSIHSLSDVLTTIIVMVGLKISSKEEDKTHPYGHEKIECVFSFLLSIFLFITGIMIGVTGIKLCFFTDYDVLETPTLIALIAAVVSIVVKELMYQYTKKIAIKIKSDALLADAWHHRSDSLSSIGSMIGIIGAMYFGLKRLDAIASIIICFCIIKVSYDILMDSINKMVDHSCSEDVENNLKEIILDTDGVLGIDLLKTRLFGNKIYVDVEIKADKDLNLKDAHDIAKNVHDKIEANYEDIKHCMVHINPSE